MRSLAWAALAALFCAMPSRAQDTPSPVVDTLNANGVGTIFGLAGLDPLGLDALPVTRTYSGGRIIYSGSPEYCPGPGVLYRDTFPAGTDVRLYVYHVNASKAPLRFSVVLEPVDGPARVAVRNSIVIGPSRDYFSVGRLSAFIQLGRPVPPRPRVVDVNRAALLDADLDGRVVPPGRPEPLIHSLHDFRVEGGSVRVSVVAVEADAGTLERLPTLNLLPRDRNHDRGTYQYFTRDAVGDVPFSTDGGVRHIRMADGVADAWTEGGDVTTGRAGAYRGGYGVMYRLRLRLQSPDGRKVALALNPRGGGLGGAVSVEIPKHGRSTQYTPALGLRPVEDKEEAVILAKWDPSQTPDVTVVWTPPGAASLPVEFLLIPY